MSNVCIIPARGGSTRIPRKNIQPFMGKPIIAYSIRTAIDCAVFDRVIVSTDDDRISEIAQEHGADVIIRPASHARDEIGTQEVMAQAMTKIEGYDMACCLYATAPMVTGADLIQGWQRLHTPGTIYAMAIGTEPLHDPGQWYWGHTWAFRERIRLLAPHTAMVPIPTERVCDINTHADWQRAEMKYHLWMENLTEERYDAMP